MASSPAAAFRRCRHTIGMIIVFSLAYRVVKNSANALRQSGDTSSLFASSILMHSSCIG